MSEVITDSTVIEEVYSWNFVNRYNEEIDEATIICSDTTQNRNIEKGEKIRIESSQNRNDLPSVLWAGRVQESPTSVDNEQGKMRIKAEGESVILKYQDADRIFYETTYANAVESLVTEQAVYRQREFLTQGNPDQSTKSGSNLEEGYVDNVVDWETNIPELTESVEQKDGSTKEITRSTFQKLNSSNIYQSNGNVLVGFLKQGLDGEYYMRRKNINSKKFRDGFKKAELKFYAKTNAVFDLEVEISDQDNTSYVWQIPKEEIDFGKPNVEELKVENASSDNSQLTNTNQFEIRINMSGETLEEQAVGIDFLKIFPFDLEEREEKLSVNTVKGDEKITRRVQGKTDDILQDFAFEAEASYFVDRNREFNFIPLDQNNSSVNIDVNNIAIKDYEVERDYKNIKNRVTVTGSNDVRVRKQNKDSVRKYGIKERSENINDPTLVRQIGAIRRAEGFLRENAFRDTQINIQILDETVQDPRSVTAGQRTFVSISGENISNVYRITEKKLYWNGKVDLKLVNLQETSL